MKLRGVYTALVTPFNEDGSVDEPTLRKLVDQQIEAGVAGLVPCGTTGESPTLSHEEHEHVIQIVVNQAAKRCQVIAGAGSNSTQEAIELTEFAKKAGCDAVLSVNPYYNKPTQEGLYRHFKAIAEAVDIPIVLYNIKGRTGVNIETSTLLRLAEMPTIVAVKEASGDMNQIKDVIEQTPEDFAVLSGDDNITLDLVRAGGDGVISVISNFLPEQMNAMVQAALNQEATADELQEELFPLMEAEFIETNPIPIKAMMAMKGMLKEVYRLPLCELGAENRAAVEKLLKEKELI